MKNFFTLLGGMGSIASESFLHLLNQYTPATKDQEFLNYLLVNHAKVPDRTNYILNNQNENPLPYLLEDIQQQSLLKPNFFVLLCNTAHYFYDELQNSTTIPILNMPKITVEHIDSDTAIIEKVGIIATEGSIRAGIYEKYLQDFGYEVVLPTPKIQKTVNEFIYNRVKKGEKVTPSEFSSLLNEMSLLGAQQIILGCTELSYIYEFYLDTEDSRVIDPQIILAKKVIELQLSFQ